VKRGIPRGLGAVGLSFLVLVFLSLVLEFFAELSVAMTYRQVSAVVLPTDHRNGGQHPYQYRVGDRLCRGVSHLESDPAEITVRYNPADVCMSQWRDPWELAVLELLILLQVGSCAVAVASSLLESFRAPGRTITQEVGL
jgi:hypothetical protein